jgi:hypothetical protein
VEAGCGAATNEADRAADTEEAAGVWPAASSVGWGDLNSQPLRPEDDQGDDTDERDGT